MWRYVDIVYTLLLLSCQIIPMQGLYDEWIAPKWYASAFAICILLWVKAWTYMKTSTNDAGTDGSNSLSVSAFIVLAADVIYVTVCCIVSSPHTVLPVHGTFDNPTGYALQVAVLVPLCMCRSERCECKYHWLIIVTCLLATITVILSMCRTGIICVTAYWTVYLLRHVRIRRWISCLITVLSICLVTACMFQIKTDSTHGRGFILWRTWSLIAERPVTGYGPHGFSREYMPAQAEFFMENPGSRYAWLADDINHPFNEYMYAWVNLGLLGLVLAILVPLLPILISWHSTGGIRQNIYVWPLAIIMFFMLTSYPHQYPIALVIVLLAYMDILYKIPARKLIAAAYSVCSIGIACYVVRGFVYEHKWHRANEGVRHGYARQAIHLYDTLSDHYGHNSLFLYTYMYAAYQSHQFEKAITIYANHRQISSTYNLELLAGDTYYHLNQHEEALSHYREAHYMVPVRFAPLAGMMEAYAAMGDTLHADSMAQVILAKPVKVPSPQIDEIKRRAKGIYDLGIYDL